MNEVTRFVGILQDLPDKCRTRTSEKRDEGACDATKLSRMSLRDIMLFLRCIMLA